MKLFSKNLLILCLGLSLSACTWTWRTKPDTRFHEMPKTAGMGVGAGLGVSALASTNFITNPLIGGAIGSVVGMSEPKIRHHLALVGVKVISVGECFRVIIPADDFFEVNSDELKPSRSAVLNDLAMLIKRHRMPDKYIAITGYSDDLFADRYARHLTLQRAQRLASYLWTRGVDQHYMFPVGMGSELEIAENSSIRGYLANRRIEITIEPHCNSCR